MTVNAVNPKVGFIKCFACGNQCDVRESRKNKLYYVCFQNEKNEGCGQFLMAYKGGQKLMNEKTVFDKTENKKDIEVSLPDIPQQENLIKNVKQDKKQSKGFFNLGLDDE